MLDSATRLSRHPRRCIGRSCCSAHEQEIIRIDIDAGRAADVIADIADLAAQHPLREPVHELLVTALSSLGRQAEALEALRRIRGRLAEELGIDPGPRLQRLEAMVLSQDPDLVGSEPQVEPIPAAADGPSSTVRVALPARPSGARAEQPAHAALIVPAPRA